jgi:hypothetical protein
VAVDDVVDAAAHDSVRGASLAEKGRGVLSYEF